MESKRTLDKVVLWADKHGDTIIDAVFIMILVVACVILTQPFWALPYSALKTTLIIANIAFCFMRGLIGKKYKRLGGYLYGIGIVIIIIVFRLLYL